VPITAPPWIPAGADAILDGGRPDPPRRRSECVVGFMSDGTPARRRTGESDGRVRTVLPLYLTAAVLVRLADEGARVSLVLLGLDRTGSTAFSGALVAALLVPHVLAAPLVGGLADRVRRRRAFHSSGLLLFGSSLALCGWLAGWLPPAVVLFIAAVGGCAGPLVSGGLTGLLRDLVPEDRLTRAYSLDAMSYNLAGICGPALVGLLAAAFGSGPATLAIAVSAMAGGATVFALPLADRKRRGTSASMVDTLRRTGVLWRDRTLRAVTVATSLGQAGTGGLPLAVALLTTSLGAASTSGAILAAYAAGGLVGSLCYARLPVGADVPERVVMACLVAIGVPIALTPVLHNVAMVVTAFVLAGLFTGPLTTALLLTRDRLTPPDVHAQVFAVGAGLKTTAAAAGSAAAGMFAGLQAPGLLWLVAASHWVAAVAGTAILARRGRRA
jgi:MFS family permease